MIANVNECVIIAHLHQSKLAEVRVGREVLQGMQLLSETVKCVFGLEKKTYSLPVPGAGMPHMCPPCCWNCVLDGPIEYNVPVCASQGLSTCPTGRFLRRYDEDHRASNCVVGCTIRNIVLHPCSGIDLQLPRLGWQRYKHDSFREMGRKTTHVDRRPQLGVILSSIIRVSLGIIDVLRLLAYAI